MTRECLVVVLNHYVEVIFPKLTGLFDWPVKFNHCFRRIIYDNVLQAKCSDARPYPIIENLSHSELLKCIKLCDDIIENPDLLVALNVTSLNFRGKLCQTKKESQ